MYAPSSLDVPSESHLMALTESEGGLYAKPVIDTVFEAVLPLASVTVTVMFNCPV